MAGSSARCSPGVVSTWVVPRAPILWKWNSVYPGGVPAKYPTAGPRKLPWNIVEPQRGNPGKCKTRAQKSTLADRCRLWFNIRRSLERLVVIRNRGCTLFGRPLSSAVDVKSSVCFRFVFVFMPVVFHLKKNWRNFF